MWSFVPGNQPWIFTERTDAEAEAPILWPPDMKSCLIGKDPDVGTDWRQEEKGVTEDETVGWHHWLDGHEFEQSPGDGEGQGSLACCSPWGSQRVRQDIATQQQWMMDIFHVSFLLWGCSHNELAMITSPWTWEEVWKVEKFATSLPAQCSLGCCLFPPTKPDQFQNCLFLSSLWFDLIYCTWNLISSWPAFTFFHILVIHILSFSFQFFESSSYSWRKAALPFYLVNAQKTKLNTGMYHYPEMSLWSGRSSESDVWWGLSTGPIRDLLMEKNAPIPQEFMFLWQGQITASHKTIQAFWHVGMCPSPWLQQPAQTGDATKVLKLEIVQTSLVVQWLRLLAPKCRGPEFDSWSGN